MQKTVSSFKNGVLISEYIQMLLQKSVSVTKMGNLAHDVLCKKVE